MPVAVVCSSFPGPVYNEMIGGFEESIIYYLSIWIALSTLAFSSLVWWNPNFYSFCLWKGEESSFMLVHLALNLVNLLVISRSVDARLAFTEQVVYGRMVIKQSSIIQKINYLCRQSKEFQRSGLDITLLRGCWRLLLQLKKTDWEWTLQKSTENQVYISMYIFWR